VFQTSEEFRQKLYRRLGPPMVLLSLLFLLLLGASIHRFEEPDGDEPLTWMMLGGLLLLWPVFVIELFLHYFLRDRNEPFWQHNKYDVLACLLPPLRMGDRCHALDNQIWVPFLGWKKGDRYLRKKLEKFFSIPMIIIALMILPLLAIEFGDWDWAHEVREHPWVRVFLYVGTTIIWFAFAVEFVVMVSVADKKLHYCATHWLDLAIILLPVIAFLRTVRLLQLSRLGRLSQISQMTRVYRLRGLSMRAWRAVLLLNVIQRLTGQTLEKRLIALEAMLRAKLEEV
jgi:voltage-gated potassium channel